MSSHLRLRGRPSLYVLLLLLAASSSAFAFKMEAGAFRINATFGAVGFTNQLFQQNYDTPPIVIILATSAGGQPASVRLRNVTTTGFEAIMIEPINLDGGHVDMDVHYFAIEPGVHQMDVVDGVSGMRTITIEAGTLTTDKIVGVCGSCGVVFDTHNFSGTFPVGDKIVLAQLQTIANGFAEPPPTGPADPYITAVIDNLTTTQFDYAIDRHEVDNTNLTTVQAMNETIGFIALEADIVHGDFTADGVAMTNIEMETQLDTTNAAEGWNNGPFCDNDISFSKAFPGTRLAVAMKESRNEVDGGWLRRCAINNNALRVVVDEDQFADSERNHVFEDVGMLLFSDSFFFDSNFIPPTAKTGFQIEADQFMLTPGVPSVVQLRQFYDPAPAIFLIADESNLDPTSLRVSAITNDPVAGTTSITAVAIESPGGPSNPDVDLTINYVAATKGTFEFPDTTQINIGDRNVTALQQNFGGTDSFQTLFYDQTFDAAPAVITEIFGDNNTTADPAVPWLTPTIASSSVTANGFDAALDRSEVNVGTVTTGETLSFLAIENKTIGTFMDNAGNSIFGEAQTSQLNGNSNAGWDDICAGGTPSIVGIPFSNVYGAPPLVVGSEVSHNGGDGGWHRLCGVTNTNVVIVEDEDQTANNERAHTREDTAFVAFSQAFDADLSFAAWYQMEESLWNAGAPGTVVNVRNAATSGTPLGDAQTTVATPARTVGGDSTCRYGEFDGSGDVIEIGGVDLGLVDAVTVSAWVRKAATGNAGALIVGNDLVANNLDLQFSLRLDGATGDRVEFSVVTTSGSQTVTGATVLTPGTWYYVTGTYDGSNLNLSIGDGVTAMAADGTVAHTGDFVAFDANRILNIGQAANGGNSFNGSIDEVRIYTRALTVVEQELNRQVLRSCQRHDHYAITVDSAIGVTCQPSEVTITAHDVADIASPPAAATIVTITSSGAASNWSLVTGTPANFNDMGGGAVSTYTWNGTESQIVLNLSQTAVDPAVDIDTLDTEAKSEVEDAQIDFRDIIIDFDTVPTQISRRPSAGIQAQVLRDDGGSGCTTVEPLVGQNVDFGFECHVPATNCTGNTDGEVDAVGVAAFDQGPFVPSDTVSLNFSPSATIVLQYNDAGQVSLRAVTDVSGSTAEGVTNQFVTRPFGFHVEVTDSLGGANPGASTAAGGVFEIAGEDFTVALTPVAWHSGDDLNADGIPDGHESGDLDPSNNADLSPTPGGNNTVPENYDTSAMSDGKAALGGVLLLPSSVSAEDPGLTAGGSPARVGPFSGGSVQSITDANFDEVGVIEITAAQTGDYLSIGGGETSNIRGHSSYVGRFIPAYIDVASTANFMPRNATGGWNCGFTYLGQPFALIDTPQEINIEAYTASGALANNYADSTENFIKFSGLIPNRDYAHAAPVVAASPTFTENLTGSVTLTNQTDFDGAFTLELTGDTFNYSKVAPLDFAFSPTLSLALPASDLEDSDGVCHADPAAICNTGGAKATLATGTPAAHTIGGISDPAVEMRVGRLVLSSASGSELLDLTVPLRAEYFIDAGGGNGVFTINTDDNDAVPPADCTALDLAAHIRLTDASSPPEINGDSNPVTLIGVGGTTNITAPAAGTPFGLLGGQQPLIFAAPGAANTGHVDIRVDLGGASLPWLQHDWNGDGSYTDDPSARASFGIFPGRQEVIYIREPWE
ncbi:MAG: LamG domain-containing protein [Pseudomonadota bacterium]